MAIKWTDEQLRAIETKSGAGSILVSAAAGSGKTAVLVERIIRMIKNKETSIDRLLVVTFTNAAAAQMREKIVKKLYQSLKTDCDDKDWISKQIGLLPSADIATIDSFCMRVLKNNFYALGVDPDFRIADNAESQIIADQAIDGLFDRLYNADKNTEDYKKFNHLLNIYADNRSDKGLKNQIKSIYDFSQSFAMPKLWLAQAQDMYSSDMEHSGWMRQVIPHRYIREIGMGYYKKLQKLVHDMAGEVMEADRKANVSEAEANTVIMHYTDMAKGVFFAMEVAKMLIAADSWNVANAIYNEHIHGSNCVDGLNAKMKPKDILVDWAIWKKYCSRRNKLIKDFFGACSIFRLSENEVGEAFHGPELKNQIDELVWLVELYGKEFARQKEIRNIKEFSDIEHLVCDLFLQNEDVRNEYIDKYDEILIDEYQDTNGLQDTIFTSISKDCKNIFMVGDLKQSIYRFRGGDPTIFKGKSFDFDRPDTNDVKIDLSENFRSGQEVLSCVNDMFEAVMSDYTGDVDYGDTEKIVRHSDADVWDDKYRAEMHYLTYQSTDSEEDAEQIMIEAEFVADKISDMVKSGFTVRDEGKERPIRLGDITILSRSVRMGFGDVVKTALDKRNIPSYIEIEDYFQKREIKTMLALISVIDNNLQDIPLAAVMRSPIGNFSENDMARIRIYTRSGYLYNAIKNYRTDEEGITKEEIALKIKCRNFTSNLKRWRGYLKQKTVAQIIWSIYEETGFYDFMGAYEGGYEAQANLRLLYERAKAYEALGFGGLFNFVKYIARIEEQGDLSGASMASEGADAVRVMTMHKSKGLEFPVVFLVGMGKKLRSSSAQSNIILHKDYGIAIKYADAELGYFEDNLCTSILKKLNDRENLSELMRLLYVGMTRPKNKLIVVAAAKMNPTKNKTYEDKVSDQLAMWKNHGIEPEEATNYVDWICPVAMSGVKSWEFYHHDAQIPQNEDTVSESGADIEVSDELRQAVCKSFEYEYEYSKSGTIASKTSVTALKQKNIETVIDEHADRRYEYDPIYMDTVPEFMRDKKLGSEIGTAHHQVMAYIDLDKIRELKSYSEFVDSEILRIAKEGQIDKYYYEDEKMRENINKHICGFFESSLGKAMLLSNTVYRERAFEIEIPATEYDTSLEDKYSNEKVILQGIIDCFFETDKGVVLLDYKTDYSGGGKKVDEIKEKYSIQLDLYKRAIERITGKKVVKKYLYLFDMGKEYEIF